MICFYDLWKITELAQTMEAAKFKQLRFLEWVKTNPVPINQSVNYLTNAREIALLGVKGGKPTFNSKYDNGIYEYPIEHSKGRFHPTQKSLKLIRELIEKHSNPGDTVLDCFAGSCTTGVAALELGRSFVGCELDPGYFSQAQTRLSAAGAVEVR
jgi:DNA modification methylase